MIPSDGRFSMVSGTAAVDASFKPATLRAPTMSGTQATATPEFVTRIKGSTGSETSDAIAAYKRYYDGEQEWGPTSTGGATDTSLERTAVGVLSVGAANARRTGRAVTGSRLAAATVGAGGSFYDTTLAKMIDSDGPSWKETGYVLYATATSTSPASPPRPRRSSPSR